MSVHTSQKTSTTYRTVKVASPEPVTSTVFSARTVSPLPSPLPTAVQSTVQSTVPYAVNGYETVRYLVPVQQAVQQQSYYVMQQPMIQQPMMQQPMMQQPMMQQVVSPVYLQSVQGLQRLSVSSQESDLMYQQHSMMEVSPASAPLFSAAPLKTAVFQRESGGDDCGTPGRMFSTCSVRAFYLFMAKYLIKQPLKLQFNVQISFSLFLSFRHFVLQSWF